MTITGQFLLVLLFSVSISRILNFGLIGILASAFVPLALYFPANLLQLFFSLSLAFLLARILRSNKAKNTTILLGLLTTLIVISLLVFKPIFFQNIVDTGVINAQRGEHVSYQTNIIARLLHNKISNTSYYLNNLVKQLSPSVIFASGNYPNFSKYIPIAFIFPWYIFLFIASLKQNIKKYLKYPFIISLSVILILASISTGIFDWFLVSSLIWFIVFESAAVLSKLSKKWVIPFLVLNLLYLFAYILPINYFINSKIFFL